MAYTTIDNPADYFTTVLSTSTGSALTIDTGFKPDWLWTKARNFARSHELHDTTRGDNKRLKSDANTAEESYSNYLTFTSTGATFGTNHNLGYHAEGATTGVSWAWKANGGTRTTNTESGNNPGGGYQANTTAGFSIVDYTGTGSTGTMAHGLGAVPHMILFKARSEASNDWAVYHQGNTSAPETDFLRLNTTGATTDNANFMNDTAPTSSVFTINDGSKVNSDAETYIAYCFTEIQGYSKFGKYTGNNNADGPFVYTGFKPAWVMWKRSDASGNSWGMVDHRRNKNDTQDIGNVIDAYLAPDLSSDDSGNSATMDFLSNGFKVRRTGNFINVDGSVYVYMAFAESPFVSSKGVPTTAR